MQNLSFDKQFSIFINEVLDRRVFVSIVFAFISICILLIGIYIPKNYESRASILWSSRDSLSPLLRDGVAETTTLNEQASIAREVILSNKALDTMIIKAGMNKDSLGNDLSSKQLEVLKGELRKNIRVTNQGQNLIVISYRNTDSELSYIVVSVLSELLIQETREVKNKSSQAAYDFINRQVMDYKVKLDYINQNIISFRKDNVDLDSDTRSGVNTRVNNLKALIRETTLQLTESRVQKKSLEEQRALEKLKIQKQLLANSQIAVTAERESAYAERLAALQSNLDNLRLSYTESYPDIIQLKEQIKNLKTLIEDENEKRSTNMESGSNNDLANEIGFIDSPLYTNLSNEIANVETQIQTLEARIIDSESRLNMELERAGNVNTLESELEEMTRDLDVTQSIYDDLLARRENARVSLNLQLENQGSTFKIQEPATLPLVPVGLRFLHFALLSIPLGLLVPLGLILGYLLLDPRFRDEDSVDSGILGIPVIATVDHYSNDMDKKEEKQRNYISGIVVAMSFVLIGIIAILRINHLIGV